jgi:hypothetical protein
MEAAAETRRMEWLKTWSAQRTCLRASTFSEANSGSSMPERFVQFRLSLLLREQPHAFAPDWTREEYLRIVFREEQTFDHYGAQYTYRPSELQPSDEVVFGYLGRVVVFEENLPPEEGFVESTREGWKASVIVVDPADHSDGQRVAMEFDKQVGNPLKLFASLVDNINRSHPESPYTIDVQPIVDTSSFWAWAERNKGNVSGITFKFVAPNGLFSARSNLREELRAAKERSNANHVDVTLQNKEGLDTDSEPVHEAVDYIEKAGGKITARAGKRRFSSTNAHQITALPKEEDPSESVVRRAARRIAAVFGRE